MYAMYADTFIIRQKGIPPQEFHPTHRLKNYLIPGAARCVASRNPSLQSKRDFMEKRICFLDRDGVLIEDKNYLSDINDVCLVEDTVEALQRLKAMQFDVVVVSNQSGVARGKFSESVIPEIHQRINALLPEELQIHYFYYCPHYPNGTVPPYNIVCDCRKPAPGMLRKASETLLIPLNTAIVIGDKMSDIEAGRAAGCAWEALVLTGHGIEEKSAAESQGVPVFPNLNAALMYYQSLSTKTVL